MREAKSLSKRKSSWYVISYNFLVVIVGEIQKNLTLSVLRSLALALLHYQFVIGITHNVYRNHVLQSFRR